jgi:hypothetical protein
MSNDIEAERKLFEMWCLTTDDGNCCEADLRKKDGEYRHEMAERDWLVWQARAALAAPQQEPVAWIDECDQMVVLEKFYKKHIGYVSEGRAIPDSWKPLCTAAPPPAAPVLSARDEKIQAHPTPEGYPVEGVFGVVQQTPVAIVEYIEHGKHHGKHIRMLTQLPNGTRLYAGPTLAAPQQEPVAYMYRHLIDKHVTGTVSDDEIFRDGYWGRMSAWKPDTNLTEHAKRPGFESYSLFAITPPAATVLSDEEIENVLIKITKRANVIGHGAMRASVADIRALLAKVENK